MKQERTAKKMQGRSFIFC